MPEDSITKIIESVCEDICDNYCKYGATVDENGECEPMRTGQSELWKSAGKRLRSRSLKSRIYGATDMQTVFWYTICTTARIAANITNWTTNNMIIAQIADRNSIGVIQSEHNSTM